jgi:hypothetical protein
LEYRSCNSSTILTRELFLSQEMLHPVTAICGSSGTGKSVLAGRMVSDCEQGQADMYVAGLFVFVVHYVVKDSDTLLTKRHRRDPPNHPK